MNSRQDYLSTYATQNIVFGKTKSGATIQYYHSNHFKTLQWK